MTYYNSYIPIADYCTLAILIVFMIIFRSTFSSKDNKNLCFKVANFSVFVATTFNVLYMTVIAKTGLKHYMTIYIFRDIANILLLFTLVLFSKYLSLVFEKKKINQFHIDLSNYILLFIFSLLIIISPITHFGFYIDNNYNSVGDFFFEPFAIGYILFVLKILIQFIRYRKYIVLRVYVATALVILFAEGIMIGEAIANSSTLVCFTYLLPLVLFFSLFHSNSYDVKSGTLDSEAFSECIGDISRSSKEYGIICLTMLNGKNITQVLEDLFQELHHFYNRYFKYFYTFRISDNRFILIYKDLKKQKNNSNSLEAFNKDFISLYDKYGMDYKLTTMKSNQLFKDHKAYIDFINYIET